MAVYWSALKPDNQVEIALVPARIVELQQLEFFQAWFALAKEESPASCEVHKHDSDWPIIGCSFPTAIRLLKECGAVRRRLLDQKREQEVLSWMGSRSDLQRFSAQMALELEALRPTRGHCVIDLVRKADISVKHWHVKGDGNPAKAPRSNPAFCYNWSFGGGDEPALACLWHESLRTAGDSLESHGNMQEAALELEQIAKDRTQPDADRERARMQAARARSLDALIAHVAANKRALRVIVNEGHMRAERDIGKDRSVVRVRHLDDRSWDVISYSTPDGDYVLRRRGSAAVKPDRPAEPPQAHMFADQHDLGSDRPERRSTSGSALNRDPLVRMAVLERAQGHCELCDEPGFTLPDGRLFLETHHVHPLAEGGADRVTNVLALCPTHHREAHYGARRHELRSEFKVLLQILHGIESPNSSVPNSALVLA